MATYTQWTQFTPGTEVAKTFTEHIKGKTSKPTVVIGGPTC